MTEFNKKNKTYKKYLYSPFTLLVLFVVLLLLLKALYGVYSKEQLSAANLHTEQADLARMSERKAELANSINYLKTEAGVEAEMRSKFRVVKDGEQVAVIVGDDDATTTDDVPTTTPKRGFFGSIFGFLGF